MREQDIDFDSDKQKACIPTPKTSEVDKIIKGIYRNLESKYHIIDQNLECLEKLENDRMKNHLFNYNKRN